MSQRAAGGGMQRPVPPTARVRPAARQWARPGRKAAGGCARLAAPQLNPLSLSLSPHNLLSKLLSVPVDQSMFENARAGAAPAPRSGRPAAAELGSRLAGGQHLRNLGKAVGAKVNDLLRRKEPATALTEVNARAGAALGPGQPPGEDGPAALEAVPRLDPPPTVAKKRTPRALKTPQDMLIAPPPPGAGAGAGPQEPPEPAAAAAPAPAPATPGEERRAARDVAPPEGPGVAERGGGQPGALPVPDLIHKGSLESRRRGADRAAESSPCTEKPSGGTERLPPGGGPGREADGPHPDLLSFE